MACGGVCGFLGSWFLFLRFWPESAILRLVFEYVDLYRWERMDFMSYLDVYIRHPGGQVSRYQSIPRVSDQNAALDADQYTGIYEQEKVTFSRMFRGRRLTDDECEALCDGLVVTLQGLSRVSGGRTISYGVRVYLECKSTKGVLTTFRTVTVRTKDTLLYDPDYTFSRAKCEEENRALSHPKEPYTSTGTVLCQEIDGYTDEDDAMLAAMIAAPDLPLIQRVDTGVGQIPVFVPVLYADDTETEIPNGQEAVRVEHDSGAKFESEPSLLDDDAMRMENEIAMYEELQDTVIMEDLEVDEDDQFEDEGIDPDEPQEEIDEDGVFA